MHFAVIAHAVSDIKGDLAIHGYGDIRPKIPGLENALLDTRETLLQAVQDVTHRPPRDANLCHTTGEVLQHSGDKDERHAFYFSSSLLST
jgi:hypothetical protein